jgi:hypothetical protein
MGLLGNEMIPDLLVWRRAFAVVSVVVLAVIGAGLMLGPPQSQAYHDYNLKRLNEFRAQHDPRNPRALRVVMLGNSRLKNATIDSAMLERLATDRSFEGLEQFRLVANWAVFRNFEPLLDELQALDPDLYVIQLDMLADDMTRTWTVKLTYHYLRWLANGEGAWSWFEPQEEQLEAACAEHRFPNLRALRANLKLVTDPSAESPRMAHAFIEEVTGAGIPVLIVSVPKSDDLERELPSVNADALAVAESLQAQNPLVTAAIFPMSLPDELFCDTTHLGPLGSEVFSRWLMDQLASTQIAATADAYAGSAASTLIQRPPPQESKQLR